MRAAPKTGSTASQQVRDENVRQAGRGERRRYSGLRNEGWGNSDNGWAKGSDLDEADEFDMQPRGCESEHLPTCSWYSQ